MRPGEPSGERLRGCSFLRRVMCLSLQSATWDGVVLPSVPSYHRGVLYIIRIVIYVLPFLSMHDSFWLLHWVLGVYALLWGGSYVMG